MKLSEKLKFTVKFNIIGIVLVLAVVGAGEAKDKLHWQDAVAAENKAEIRQMIDAADVKVQSPPAYPDTKLDKLGKEKIDWDKLADGGF